VGDLNHRRSNRFGKPGAVVDIINPESETISLLSGFSGIRGQL
jgi:hypothetical protein